MQSFTQMYHLQSDQGALATHQAEVHPNDEEVPTENVVCALLPLKQTQCLGSSVHLSVQIFEAM